MDLDTYNQTFNNLKTQYTRLMDRLDSLDPADDRYESLNEQMIAIQTEMVALDAQYNAERRQ